MPTRDSQWRKKLADKNRCCRNKRNASFILFLCNANLGLFIGNPVWLAISLATDALFLYGVIHYSRAEYLNTKHELERAYES